MLSGHPFPLVYTFASQTLLPVVANDGGCYSDNTATVAGGGMSVDVTGVVEVSGLTRFASNTAASGGSLSVCHPSAACRDMWRSA